MPDGTQEEFFDTIRRCVEGSFTIQMEHCKKSHLPWDAYKAQKSAQTMFKKMWEFKFLPPGRGLWTMGSPIVDKIGSASLCNCGFVSTKDIDKDFAEPFAWAADMLMLGVGIGYDTLGAGKVTIFSPGIVDYNQTTQTYQIPDTREGWVESIKILLNSYKNQNINGPVEFDYSLIRPAGTPIKGFGGTASGPDPLRDGHENIRKLLDSYDGRTLDSVGIVDIMNYIGKFVVAGNVRRSAEIAIGNIEDQNFIEMKDYTKYPEELKDRRWMSNNTVFSNPDSDFSKIVPNIALNGEPGILFLENCRSYGRVIDGPYPKYHPKYDEVDGVNPCAEQCLRSYELCNLVETFPANHDSPEEYYDTLKYAYLYAKSVTLLPTHCEKTNQIMLQNRRIGCSQSGIQQAIKKFGIQRYLNEFCNKGYKTVEHWDLIYSRWLGIPTSIRYTTVKPSGTVSLLAGATPGVHCTHSEYYYRTIRIAANSPYVKTLKDAKYKIEESVTDKNTLVVYFPVKEKNFTKSKYDISLWEQLVLVKELQYYWSDNSVSCTITFKPEEVKDLKSAIDYMAPYVKTLSFLPLDNHAYPQAPYQTITEKEYLDYSASLLPLVLDKKEEAKGERYCTNDVCAV
jgi:adenosylcobalamin-dependent ribonucleoside-triphosphate reductase